MWLVVSPLSKEASVTEINLAVRSSKDSDSAFSLDTATDFGC